MCQCMYVYSSHDLCAHVQMVCNEGTVLTLKTNYGAPNYRVMNVDSVSYTHLTLPTNREV